VRQAEVEEAAKLANAHSFICALPQGYATQARRARPTCTLHMLLALYGSLASCGVLECLVSASQERRSGAVAEQRTC
jgi:hypothetical protein